MAYRVDTQGNELRVYVPEATETLEQYFQRYTDEELQNILHHPELSKQICSHLLGEIVKHDRSKETEQFQEFAKKIKNFDDYGCLRHFVWMLKPTRQKLLQSLEVAADQIEQYTKYGSISRLVFSAIDIGGTVGGLWMQNSSHDFSNYAFPASTVCGIFNTFSTIAESYLSENARDDILNLVRKDIKLFTHIQNWFQQKNRLYETMQNMFPFECTIESVNDFIDVANSDPSAVRLLQICLRRAAEIDIQQIRNRDWLENLVAVISNANVNDICKWLIFQHNPIIFDIGRVLLQLGSSPNKYLLFQYVPTLYPHDQNLWSIPVWARISLNFGTMLNSIKTLRKSEISTLASEMRHLREELKAQMDFLDRIISYCR